MTLGAAFRYFATHSSPWLLFVICSSFWSTRAYLALSGNSPFTSLELYIAFGVLTYWPFQEWWMHRWLLHLGSIKIFGKTIEPHFAKTHRHRGGDGLAVGMVGDIAPRGAFGTRM